MDTGRRPVRQLLLICKRRLGVAGKRGCGRLSEPEKKYSGLARSRPFVWIRFEAPSLPTSRALERGMGVQFVR
jgi:hypothetical protein